MGRPKAQYNEQGQKQCVRCHEFKDVAAYPKSARQWDGYEPRCKACRNGRYAELPHKSRRITDLTKRKRLPRLAHVDGKKLCSKCKQWLALGAYSTDRAYWDRLRPYCKQCSNQRRKDAAKKRGYWLQGRRVSVQAHLAMILRTRLHDALRGRTKADHTLVLVGCTLDQLKVHLEQQFTEGMTWFNYGFRGWHIDHVIPCASFDLTDPVQQRMCFHYTNLQPLWAADNFRKGKNSHERKTQEDARG